MLDYENLEAVKEELRKAQGAEEDQRNAAREAKLFIVKRDGQWDPYVWTKMDGRFRGTFDMCTPVVDQIAGEIDEADFNLTVSPSAGESSEESARVFNGLVRNIRNASNADDVFNQVARSNVIGGFDCFEIVQDYIDADSFDQDLFIRKIPSAVDSVWFDCGATERDKSDAMFAFKLAGITPEDFETKYPNGGSGASVGQDLTNAYYNKPDLIIIGQLYYKKKENIELVKMSNGAVYKADEDFDKVKDELEQAGITEVDRRTRKGWRVYSRLFDNNDWLTGPQRTVFNHIPLCPIYGNYDVVENKPVYFGIIEKLYDIQRTHNYVMSRNVEDTALAPNDFFWMTDAQVAGNEEYIQQMNTDNRPVRIYNADDEAPGPPQRSGGVLPSPGLLALDNELKMSFQTTSNIFTAQQGNADPSQSGIAGRQQIEAGQTGSIKWFKALQVAVEYAGKVLINAIPRVYDSTRQVRIIEEDGTSRLVTLNDVVFDAQSGQTVELNNLSKGDYDVVCEFGPAFKTQQQETTQAFIDIAQVDPSVLEFGKDIFLKNMNSPGMNQIAERVREQMLLSGRIPQSQWTEEEAQQMQIIQQQQANQPQEPTPEMILAQAEMLKGQADIQSAQNDQAKLQVEAAKIKNEQAKIQIEAMGKQEKLQSETAVNIAKVEQGNRELDLKEQQQAFMQFMEQQKAQSEQQAMAMQSIIDMQKVFAEKLNTQADTLKTLREATGADVVISEGNAQAIQKQAEIVIQEQSQQE